MADEILKRDQNSVTVLAGVTDDANLDIKMLRVDPTTKRLLVSATATTGTMAIGGSITDATAGSILFAGPLGVLAQDNANLSWDNTNKRLNIGTGGEYISALSTYGLQTNGWFQASNLIATNTFSEYFSRSDTSTASRIRLVGTDSTGYIAFQVNGSEIARMDVNGINKYSTTLTDVVNTTTETTTLSFVIPANTMNNGDIIEIVVPTLVKNNSGSAANYQAKIYSNATVIGVLAPILAFGDGTDTSEYLVIYKVKLYRVGTYLITIDPAGEAQVKNEMSIWSKDPISTGTNVYYPITATPDFTASQTITIKIQFDVAHATVYFKPQTSKIYKF